MILYTVIYVTLINLTENGMYYFTAIKELSISLFMSFNILNFGHIKIIFLDIKTSNICFFVNVNMHRYSYIIKLIIIFGQTGILLSI